MEILQKAQKCSFSEQKCSKSEHKMFYLYDWNVHLVNAVFQIRQPQIADFQGIMDVKFEDNLLPNTFSKCSKSTI